MNKVVKYYSLLFCFVILSGVEGFLSGCKKDKDQVPEVYVNIDIYATDPAFSPLNATGGYMYYSGGSRGIVIYRKSQTEFMAYDRHCSYNVSEGNTVAVDASGIIAVDNVCSSKFLLTDGSPNSGAAVNPLKRYQTTFDGTVLHIFN